MRTYQKHLAKISLALLRLTMFQLLKLSRLLIGTLFTQILFDITIHVFYLFIFFSISAKILDPFEMGDFGTVATSQDIENAIGLLDKRILEMKVPLVI